MDNYNDEVDFVESLYNNANDQLKDVYKEQKKNKDDLLKEIADVILTYTVADAVMNLTNGEKSNLSANFLDLITKNAKSQGAATEKVTTQILNNTVNDTFKFYSYNAELKDVEKIINNNYKGKHFSERVWNNEKEVAKYLHKQTQDFLHGKVNVNQIKKHIQDTYNNNAYEVKRLVDTEVSRCQNEAFNRFCKETNVRKLHYHATLCRSCSACAADDNEIFDFDSAPEIPRHPICHCYYSVEE